MNETCGPPTVKPLSLTIVQINLAFAIILPLYAIICFVIFLKQKETSLFLKKRSLDSIIIVFVGLTPIYLESVIVNVIGLSNVPLAFLMFLLYSGYGLTAFGPLAGLTKYRNEVSSARLNQEVVKQRDSKVNISEKELNDLRKGEVSFAAFFAHLRVSLCRSRSRADRLLNAKFSKTKTCMLFWFLVVSLPYLIAYIARLATDPLYYLGCTGHDIPDLDLSILLGLWASSILTGLLTLSPRLDYKRDPLLIKRQVAIHNYISGPVLLIMGVLLLIDPGDLNAEGLFSWRMLVIISIIINVTHYTIYPIIASNSMKKALLVSENFNLEDRFNEVMNDSTLRKELINYLNSELSSEILSFLFECDEYKILPPSDRKEKAAAIFKHFIKPQSIMELNLSSEVRAEVTALYMDSTTNEISDLDLFDKAYQQIRNNLLNDGFIRFLNRLKKDETTESKRAVVVNASPV